MQVINKPVEGPLTLTDDCELWGSVAGDVTVPSPHRLEVKGNIQGNVTVEKGAALILDGAVFGNVKNAGRVEVYGILRGAVEDLGGETVVADTAMVLPSSA